jgi:hypothetical protein
MESGYVKIKLQNDNRWTTDTINEPILVNDVEVGVVTEVDNDYIYGFMCEEFATSPFEIISE